MINPWHDVNIGKDAPEYVMGVVEIPISMSYLLI